ncbi:hypothetical protein GUJ93_ZPchr0010g10390 [Zizania palustris]|uniref:RING-type domain-containing protein n=1 Tax=Zizania palustris TaxID=103762 RepID=A0A8J5WCJ0_ZIZPA|nr:hypothetical protein GUJ93_ZPchr0010g10390 [Zizania palustris]
MEPRLLHYSARALLLVEATTPGPSLAPAAAAAGVPSARLAAEHDGAGAGAIAMLFNAHAIAVLALLICGLFSAIALHVVLQCALRVTRRACYRYYGADASAGAGQDPTGVSASAAAVGGGGGGRARHGGGRGGGSRKLVEPPSKKIACVVYTAGLELAGSSPSLCAICLAEFSSGEQVRVLPNCNHGFHQRCIDRWLRVHPTCPTCRQPPFPAEPVAPDLPAGTQRRWPDCNATITI